MDWDDPEAAKVVIVQERTAEDLAFIESEFGPQRRIRPGCERADLDIKEMKLDDDGQLWVRVTVRVREGIDK